MLHRTKAFLLRMTMAAVSIFLGVAITTAACAVPSNDAVSPVSPGGQQGQPTMPLSPTLAEEPESATAFPALPTPPALPDSLGSPTRLTASAGEREDEVILRWVPGNNATTHLIYLSEDSGANGRYWAQAGGGASQITVDGLDPGKEYAFIVIAGQEEQERAQVRWSQWSNWAQVGPKQALVFPEPPLPPPQGVSALVAGWPESSAAVMGVVLSISAEEGTFTIRVVDSEAQDGLLPARPVTVKYGTGPASEIPLHPGSYVEVEGRYDPANNVLYAADVEANEEAPEPAPALSRVAMDSGAPPGDSASPQETMAIFDADSDYRVLTTYGGADEIELADYLDSGATGITFELKSCDQSSGDYYDSVEVVNGVLTLEPNTLGHVHGTNTDTETVCTVTATGDGVSEDREFSVYTVSDRTPSALLPGSLTVVDARATELDIRISAPGPSLGYVRLGWRKAGGQPTFGVVSGVTDGTVITISGLEPGAEYEVRAFLLSRQAFDLYREDNSGPAGTLIPEGQPAGKWIRNLAGGGLGKSQTATVTTGPAPPPPPPPPPPPVPLPTMRPNPEGEEEDDGLDTPTVTDNDGIDTPTPTVTDNDGKIRPATP